MLRLLRDANAPPEMIAAARGFQCPHCDLMPRRTGPVRPVQVSRRYKLRQEKRIGKLVLLKLTSSF